MKKLLIPLILMLSSACYAQVKPTWEQLENKPTILSAADVLNIVGTNTVGITASGVLELVEPLIPTTEDIEAIAEAVIATATADYPTIPMSYDGSNASSAVTFSGTIAASNIGAMAAENKTLGGDLSGTYPTVSVVKLYNNTVASDTPSTSDVLTWNGTHWIGTTPSDATFAGQLGATFSMQDFLTTSTQRLRILNPLVVFTGYVFRITNAAGSTDYAAGTHNPSATYKVTAIYIRRTDNAAFVAVVSDDINIGNNKYVYSVLSSGVNWVQLPTTALNQVSLASVQCYKLP